MKCDCSQTTMDRQREREKEGEQIYTFGMNSGGYVSHMQIQCADFDRDDVDSGEYDMYAMSCCRIGDSFYKYTHIH